MSRIDQHRCQVPPILQDSFQAVAQAQRVPRFFVQTTAQIKAIVENASDDWQTSRRMS
jgi:hypothetical protein